MGQITSSVPAITAFNGTTNYTHDSILELTSESSTRNGGYSEAFGYDSSGNATTFRGVNQGYNADNQNTADTFDGNGNPTTYSGSSMSWDAANRALTYGTALTNGWRGDGLRGEKTNSSGTTLLLYDGGQPVLEENSSGATVAINTFGPTGFLARTSSTRTLVYTFDLQGNPSQQYNASTGALVESYLFDAYGTRQYSGGDSAAIAEPFSGYEGGAGYYTGWETASLTSALALCTHRYYDPSAGRFLNRDPILWSGGADLYDYCANQPLGPVDPQGKATIIEVPMPSGRFTWPAHFYLQVPACVPYAADPHRNMTIGFWPGGGAGIWPEPGIIEIPDPHAGGGEPIWSNNDPAFNHALCNCIYEVVAGQTYYSYLWCNCFEFANNLINCASAQAPGPPSVPDYGGFFIP